MSNETSQVPEQFAQIVKRLSELKTCTKCRQEKEVVEFYLDGQGYTNGKCKACSLAYAKSYSQKHPGIQKTASRKHHLQATYGITSKEYENLLESQGRCCAICRKTSPYSTALHKNLLVDHDHTTGKIRGLLCHSCNTLLARAKDSVDLLNQAAKYLVRGGVNGYNNFIG